MCASVSLDIEDVEAQYRVYDDMWAFCIAFRRIAIIPHSSIHYYRSEVNLNHTIEHQIPIEILSFPAALEKYNYKKAALTGIDQEIGFSELLNVL